MSLLLDTARLLDTSKTHNSLVGEAREPAPLSTKNFALQLPGLDTRSFAAWDLGS